MRHMQNFYIVSLRGEKIIINQRIKEGGRKTFTEKGYFDISCIYSFSARQKVRHTPARNQIEGSNQIEKEAIIESHKLDNGTKEFSTLVEKDVNTHNHKHDLLGIYTSQPKK